MIEIYFGLGWRYVTRERHITSFTNAPSFIISRNDPKFAYSVLDNRPSLLLGINISYSLLRHKND